MARTRQIEEDADDYLAKCDRPEEEDKDKEEIEEEEEEVENKRPQKNKEETTSQDPVQVITIEQLLLHNLDILLKDMSEVKETLKKIKASL